MNPESLQIAFSVLFIHGRFINAAVIKYCFLATYVAVNTGYEYFITETVNGEVKSKSYAMVVFTSGKYYCFTSKANQEIDMYLQKFQAAAKSFQAKK